MVLEADAVTVLGNRLGGQVQRAGAQAVDTVCHVQNGLLDVDRRVRPEILRSVAHEPPGRLHARERLVADHDPRVGLVVLEQDVVARLEALDHVVLEQERLALAGDDRVAQVGDPGDHDPHFRALVRFRREVGVDPPVQVFRLAHVDHLSVGAQKLVDAGRLGQQGDLLFSSSMRLDGFMEFKWILTGLKVSKIILHLCRSLRQSFCKGKVRTQKSGLACGKPSLRKLWN